MPVTDDAVLGLSDEPGPESDDPLVQRYLSFPNGTVVRESQVGSAEPFISSVLDSSQPGLDDVSAFQQSWLRSTERPRLQQQVAEVRTADLFCGVGGLSVGLEEAAWGLGVEVEHSLAADLDESLVDQFKRNFGAKHVLDVPIETVLDAELGASETQSERKLRDEVGDLDLLLAGPPCQGHSDLNNHTRRDDPRNALFARTVRAAEVFAPRHVLIENVPGVVHDRSRVVERAISHLVRLGYFVDSGVIRAEEVGVPQKRRRFFLLASLVRQPSLGMAVDRSRTQPRSVGWALEGVDGSAGDVFNTPSNHSAENRRRIAYLMEHDLYELPDSERPPCHRDKAHSYRSVYGRMRADRPAPTITGGFGSTGQGRFVHPHEPRTLTPHEAARVQTFPDWFDFGHLGRQQLQKAIGNAVPPLMASVALRELLIGDLL